MIDTKERHKVKQTNDFIDNESQNNQNNNVVSDNLVRMSDDIIIQNIKNQNNIDNIKDELGRIRNDHINDHKEFKAEVNNKIDQGEKRLNDNIDNTAKVINQRIDDTNKNVMSIRLIMTILTVLCSSLGGLVGIIIWYWKTKL